MGNRIAHDASRSPACCRGRNPTSRNSAGQEEQGVIHRDLKPSNILVTLHDGRPVPKVIDFGVAKAISRQLTEKTLFTAYGQMIGTPQYMSPDSPIATARRE